MVGACVVDLESLRREYVIACYSMMDYRVEERWYKPGSPNPYILVCVFTGTYSECRAYVDNIEGA
jgi:hypothetical protein